MRHLHFETSFHIAHYFDFLRKPKTIERLTLDTVNAALDYEDVDRNAEKTITTETVVHPDGSTTVFIYIDVIEERKN